MKQTKGDSGSEGIHYKPGDKVWLDAANLHFGMTNRKVLPRRHGPFEITKVLSTLTYRLKLPPSWKVHDVFHASLLSPYIETPEHGPNFTRPPPELVGTEEEYEVESIVAHRNYRRKKQYLVKWKGYPTSENSWEPADSFFDPDDGYLPLFQEYLRKHHLPQLQ